MKFTKNILVTITFNIFSDDLSCRNNNPDFPHHVLLTAIMEVHGKTIVAEAREFSEHNLTSRGNNVLENTVYTSQRLNPFHLKYFHFKLLLYLIFNSLNFYLLRSFLYVFIFEIMESSPLYAGPWTRFLQKLLAKLGESRTVSYLNIVISSLTSGNMHS